MTQSPITSRRSAALRSSSPVWRYHAPIPQSKTQHIHALPAAGCRNYAFARLPPEEQLGEAKVKPAKSTNQGSHKDSISKDRGEKNCKHRRRCKPFCTDAEKDFPRSGSQDDGCMKHTDEIRAKVKFFVVVSSGDLLGGWEA